MVSNSVDGDNGTDRDAISTTGAAPRRRGTEVLRRTGPLLLQQQYALPAITVALAVYLSIASQYFLTSRNILNITEAVAVNGIAAAFATIVIIGGGIDLSPVVIFVMTGIVCQTVLADGMPAGAAIVLGVGVGGAIGLLNGLLVAVGRLNPFIVTLGTNFLFTGLAFVITDGNPLLIENASFEKIGDSEPFLGLPSVTLIMIGAFLLAFFVMRFTRYGVHVLAVGGDAQAARLSGVPTVRVTAMLYVLAGLAAGVAGVVLASSAGSVAPFQTAGQNDLLTILAAVIIGGTALQGGRGSVIGTLVGIILLGMISNGLVLENVSTFWQPVVTGGVLLLAIGLDEIRRRSALKVRRS